MNMKSDAYFTSSGHTQRDRLLLCVFARPVKTHNPADAQRLRAQSKPRWLRAPPRLALPPPAVPCQCPGEQSLPPRLGPLAAREDTWVGGSARFQ